MAQDPRTTPQNPPSRIAPRSFLPTSGRSPTQQQQQPPPAPPASPAPAPSTPVMRPRGVDPLGRSLGPLPGAAAPLPPRDGLSEPDADGRVFQRDLAKVRAAVAKGPSLDLASLPAGFGSDPYGREVRPEATLLERRTAASRAPVEAPLRPEIVGSPVVSPVVRRALEAPKILPELVNDGVRWMSPEESAAALAGPSPAAPPVSLSRAIPPPAIFVAPRSPFALLQEDYADDPFIVVVLSMLLARASRRIVTAILPDLFAYLALACESQEIYGTNTFDRARLATILAPLGYARVKADRIIELFELWHEAKAAAIGEGLLGEPADPRTFRPSVGLLAQVSGVGEYALECYEIFCLGELPRNRPKDARLALYWDACKGDPAWYRSSGWDALRGGRWADAIDPESEPELNEHDEHDEHDEHENAKDPPPAAPAAPAAPTASATAKTSDAGS